MQRGFTLIELLCGLAVTGILATMAWPAYTTTIARTRRSDAQVALMQLQMAEERHRANQPVYGSLSDLNLAATSPSSHYQLSVAALSAAGYEARAVASGVQQADAPCRHMKIVVAGAQITYASGPNASASNDAAANARCWSMR